MGDVGSDQIETVRAVGLSTQVSVGERDSFIGKVIVGDGADSLITDNTISSTGVTVPSGLVEVLTECFWTVAYKHHWCDGLRSNIVYRRAHVDNLAAQSGDEIRSNQYLATNLIWRPVDSVDIGVEYLFGQRENKDRRRADANRLQFSFIWRLP